MSDRIADFFINIRTNPKKTASNIYDISKAFDSYSGDLDALSANKVIPVDDEKWADPIIYFLSLIDRQIQESNLSPKYIRKVIDYIANHEKECIEINNFYMNLAKRYLKEVYMASKSIPNRIECHEKALETIQQLLSEKDKIDKEQDILINDLKTKLDSTIKSAEVKSNKIVDLYSKLENKDIIDRNQDILLDNLDKSLIEKEKLDNIQNQLIDQLKKEIEYKTKIDDYQTEILTNLQKNLSEKEAVDKKQTMLLLKLKEELIEKEIIDLEQSQSIYKLETIIKNNQAQIEILNKKIEFLDNFTLKSDMRFHSVAFKLYVFFAVGLIMNLISVIYLYLSK